MKRIAPLCRLFLPLLLLIPVLSQAQVPQITGYTPQSGPVGTVLTITGSNFNTTPSGNRVFFGAVCAVPTAATATSLTVTVPPGASQQPLRVLNATSGLAGIHYRPFHVTFPSNHSLTVNDFDPKEDFTAGTGFSGTPNALATGDLDGDGKVDVIFANNDNNGGRSLAILRNQSAPGSLSFNNGFTIPIASAAASVLSLNDMDGDGRLDIIAVLMSTNGGLSVFRNTSTPGQLSFAPPVALHSPGSVLGVEDIDGDGRPDIMTDSGQGYIYRNLSVPGTLSFTPKTLVTGILNNAASATLSFYDLDQDGKPEMLCPNANTSTGKWYVVIGRNTSAPGAPSFAALTSLDSINGTAGLNLSVSDYDGDGKPDIIGSSIVVGNSYSDTISVWRNTSSGSSISFAPAVHFTAGNFPFHIVQDDLDGDGKMDFATSNGAAYTLSAFRNTSVPGSINAGSFAPSQTFLANVLPMHISIADIDGDGKPDLVTGSSYGIVSVYRNNPAPQIAHAPAAVCEGGNIKVFITSPHAGASGIQWQMDNGSGSYANLANTAPYSGVNTDTLRISAAPAGLNGKRYRVMVTTNGQAKFSQPDTLQVAALPNPVITQSGRVLSSGMPASYQFQWYRDGFIIPGATSSTYTVTRDGSYSVYVTNGGCPKMSAAVDVNGLAVAGAAQQKIRIYPNPVRDWLAVEAPHGATAVLTDLSGKELLRTDQVRQISTAALPAGCYLLRLYDAARAPLHLARIVKTAQ